MQTEVVEGKRLQVTCRKLGLDYNEDGFWAKNPNRHYPDRWTVTGVKVSTEDAVKLRAYLAERETKEQARIARRADPAYQQSRHEARQKRETRERNRITAIVTARWLLDANDVQDFVEHANESGSGRVLRTKSTCNETFETKVYMALVAWVRHNKTSYESELRAANDEAWSEANSLRPDFECGERWSDYAEEDRWAYEDARDEARRQCEHNRNELHEQHTAAAVEWLNQRETPFRAAERQPVLLPPLPTTETAVAVAA